MKIDIYIRLAALLVSLVLISYFGNFYFRLNYEVSGDPAVWGQLGDYIGGLLNPILSFISLVLIVKSLGLQHDANEGLKEEIRNTRQTEKMRSFEARLFSMIDSQKNSFSSFSVRLRIGGRYKTRRGSVAVIQIEREIDSLRCRGCSDQEIFKFLEEIDTSDQIFGVTRIFYVMIKMVDEKLSNGNGFCLEDRRSNFLAIINFTDFALLRLIMISMQFMDYPSTNYLRRNKEFNEVLSEVGLRYDLY